MFQLFIFYSTVLEMKMHKDFFLIGKNISTSLSPVIHGKLFQVKGKIGYRYRLFQEGVLPDLDALAEDDTFGGMSITIPFKKSYAEQKGNGRKSVLEYEGQFATRTKIVNTIVKMGQFKFKGYNTDIYGIEKVLGKAGRTGSTLILGAGATAQTFCGYLHNNDENQKIFVLNRSKDKVQELHKAYPKVQALKKYQAEPIDLLINTLPSEVIKQNINNYVTFLESIKFAKEVRFMDVNYRSKDRLLQKYIQSKLETKLVSLTGIDMLIWQAIEQNRLFCQSQEPEAQSTQIHYFNILSDLLLKHGNPLK